MNDPTLIRSLSLFLPLAVAGGLWLWRRPNRRLAAGALLAFFFLLPSLLIIHLLALHFQWWQFQAEGGLFLGMPVDLYLGWAVLWGFVPILAFPQGSPALAVSFMILLDLLLMPLCNPVVVLGSAWLVGEAAAALICIVPSFLLAQWTAENRHLRGRAFLHVIGFSGLIFLLLPAIILEQTGGNWQLLMDRPLWLNSLYLQFLALVAVPGLSAVQEFVCRGEGTPVPNDPPRKLTTSGVYAYLANPMQASTTACLLVWGVMLESLWVSAAGLMAFVYGAGLAAHDEDVDLGERFGKAWRLYRLNVRKWIPRLRPWHPSLAGEEEKPPKARLYVAHGCTMCSPVGQWLLRRDPAGMEIVAAEDHPCRDLNRITYDPGDGSTEEQGVAAVARALEHLHLGWALAGWAMRLPGIRGFFQILTDAVGGGPRLIPRRSVAREKSS